MNQELTPDIEAWLNTEPADRDLMQGATMLLRITKNQILYNNIMRNLSAKADVIEYHLQKAYNIRVQSVTKEKLKDLLAEVDKVDERLNLSANSTSTRSEFQRGKRADHDELPESIQQLYVDNASIMKKMRDAHAKLRLINADNSTCPDSDRYPFAMEILALDKKYRQNWNIYDHFIIGQSAEPVETIETDSRAAYARAAKLINLNKARYHKTKDEALATKMKEWYNAIPNPSDKTTEIMRSLGLL